MKNYNINIWEEISKYEDKEEKIVKVLEKIFLEPVLNDLISSKKISFESCYISYNSPFLKRRICSPYYLYSTKKTEEDGKNNEKLKKFIKEEQVTQKFNMGKILSNICEKNNKVFIIELNKKIKKISEKEEKELSKLLGGIKVYKLKIGDLKNYDKLENTEFVKALKILGKNKSESIVDNFKNIYLPKIFDIFFDENNGKELTMTIIPIVIFYRPINLWLSSGMIIFHNLKKAENTNVIGEILEICAKKANIIRLSEEMYKFKRAEEKERLYKEIALESGLKASVAAIMARNMSHNIGSHVLNYLSNPEEVNDLWMISI
jgi:hypothetical protein